MKPFKIIIGVDERGYPLFEFDPPDTQPTVSELQQLFNVCLQIVGQMKISFRGETKDGKPDRNTQGEGKQKSV